MVVCKFWQQGNCRFGDSCRFEHPSNANPNQNRFSAFGQSSGSASSTSTAAAAAANTYNVTAAGIVKDLTEDRPSWIFSAYGPGRNAPAQLFGGAQTEQSFEELRLHYYKAAAEGRAQAAVQDIDALYRQTQQQMEAAIKSPADAAQFVLRAEQQHPNRLDECARHTLRPSPGVFEEGQPRGQPQPAPAFGGSGGFGAPSQPSPAAANPFGAATSTNTTTTTSNPFAAKPAFGQPAGGSAFGQPSQLGGAAAATTTTTSAFGQPSQLGGGTSAFGQPSTLGAAPSAFGKPAAPAFGQPGGGGGTGGFGQPSTLGAKPAGFGGFGQPSQLGSGGAGAGGSGFSKFAAATPAGGSVFGQPSQPAGTAATTTTPAAGAFGAASAFGKPSTLGAASSPFGAAATNTAATSTPSPFGQPAAAAPANPFGQPSQPAAPAAANPFAAAAAAAAPNGSASPFAKAAAGGGGGAFGQPAPSASPFGQPAATAAAAAAAPPASAPDTYGPQATRQHPPLDSYAQRDPTNPARLLAFQGRRVTYERAKDAADNVVETPTIPRPRDGRPAKVWFPGGAPPYNAETELPRGRYTAAVEAQYETFVKTGRFAAGKMPETPPLREWCLWNF